MQNKINLDWFLGKGLSLNVGDVIFDSITNNPIKIVKQTLRGFNKHLYGDEELFIESFCWKARSEVECDSLNMNLYAYRFRENHKMWERRYNYEKILKMKNDDVKVEDKKVYYTQEMKDAGILPKVGDECMWECGQHEDRKIKILAIAVGFHWILVDGHNMPDTIGNISGLYPIDTRTDEEKLIDEIDKLINSTFCSTRELACQLVETYTITKKVK